MGFVRRFVVPESLYSYLTEQLSNFVKGPMLCSGGGGNSDSCENALGWLNICFTAGTVPGPPVVLTIGQRTTR